MNTSNEHDEPVEKEQQWELWLRSEDPEETKWVGVIDLPLLEEQLRELAAVNLEAELDNLDGLIDLLIAILDAK